jgi:hypothetical protein
MEIKPSNESVSVLTEFIEYYLVPDVVVIGNVLSWPLTVSSIEQYQYYEQIGRNVLY